MPSERPTKLYHFTSRPWFHFIRTEGITKGEAVASSRNHIVNFPNLTANPDPLAQRWAYDPVCWSGKVMPDKDLPVRRAAVRITVKIPPDDDRLISYRDFATAHGLDRRVYRRLDETGGWQARYWWIYRGVVLPRWFTDVEFLDDGELNWVERRMLDLVEMSASYEDALKRMGATHEGLALDMAHPDTWDLTPATAHAATTDERSFPLVE
jgi:hypothetical protein